MRARALTPDRLLAAYAAGIFPMAEGRDDERLFWVDPRRRAILPIGGLHVSRSLTRRLRRGDHRILADTAFERVVAACADRPETWISHDLARVYAELHAAGHAHSLEVWQAQRLTGGIFGVTLGAAFFGESMFSRRPDASKIALAYLDDRLRAGGFRLFDVQFMTDHLARLGAIEIPRADYRARLASALGAEGAFAAPATPSPGTLLQRRTQTS